MKTSDSTPQKAAHDDVQQPVLADQFEGRPRTVAEWTGDLLLGMCQPAHFRLADWP